MHKFFVDSSNIIDNNVTIIGDDVKHIYKVLRLSVGDDVAINVCSGNEFLGKLEELKEYDLIVVPYERADGYGIKSLSMNIKREDIKNIAIVIGPEGGFEEDDIEELKEIGAEIVTLGKRILRTETAGFVATSLLCYELGDMGGSVR